ncbi:LSU ribosomal protein L10p (P0) [hydrothermal vent metagenome]|uniref:LSU ribosomal protein L10p (P0) n=1 Tax=hydrothermal vent metagenome TaxID=652676 RepID=A0A3B1DSL0_9ZZZZ
MTKLQKSKIIENLTQEFKTSDAIIVANYKGSSHKALESLRDSAREIGAKVQVVKNSLINISLKNANLPDLELSGTNIFIWAQDQISACKSADKFASSNKETFSIVTGIIDSKVASISTINTFAKLPGRDELLGQLAATWMAPVTNFTVGLDALRKKKEEAA